MTRLTSRVTTAARAACSIALAAHVAAGVAAAQVDPGASWRTIETEHFRVHFTRALEELARRSAVNAERAFEQLSEELVTPRGKIDLLIADNVDYVNGYATPFPSNRIVIYAHPPANELVLRNYEDWSALVITHELTHIFQLDRSRGLWAVGRRVLGRHPVLFPNAFLPSWLIEGLAVYYESRITGAGRLEGSAHYMIARAAAEAQSLPALGELSRATSKFPGGETVYAYGGFIFDYLARTYGADKIPRFVERISAGIPYRMQHNARHTFGISFEQAYRRWADSLTRTAGARRAPLPGWRELTREGRYLAFPRWLTDTALVYSASTGREVTAAYLVRRDAAGDSRAHYMGRRNDLTPNVVLRDGSVLFAQPDFTDPYTIRSDLYVQRGRDQRRLTYGQRLRLGDVRADGEIVAVQVVPGSTRLVRVSRDGHRITPLTPSTLDEQWADPRWSPDGLRIAAVRIVRGSRSEVVVLDSAGRLLASHPFERASPSSPSWSPDGTRIYLASDHSGTMQLYSLVFPQGSPAVPPTSASAEPLTTTVPVAHTRSVLLRISDASAGVFSPEPSPDGRTIAAVNFRADGYHLGVAPPLAADHAVRDTTIGGTRANCPACRIAGAGVLPRAERDTSPVVRYSPWRSLLPRYWEPVVESSTEAGTSLGAATSGEDVVGRHAYFVSATWNTTWKAAEFLGAWRYAGFRQPVLNFSVEQSWERFRVLDQPRADIGHVDRRLRSFSATATLNRPRFRTNSSVSLGGDVEWRAYSSEPDTLAPLLGASVRSRSEPSLFVSAGWTNTRRPALAISREDGVSFSGTARNRWLANGRGTTRSFVGVSAGFKSLDLRGFAHHVIALRAAAGWADERATSLFSVGGLSGTPLEVISSYSIGEQRRTFGVRGFAPSTQRGTRAQAFTLEYRAPVVAPSRNYQYVPFLLDKVSVTAFGESGRAWCPQTNDAPEETCGVRREDRNPWLASVGGEVNLDTAFHYDFPARLRLGVAAPVAGRAYARAKKVSAYFTFGTAF